MAEPTRWINQSQPQTLYMAQVLLYINAVFGLIFGSVLTWLGPALGILALAGMVAAAFGIANEKKWGYLLGVGVGALQVAILIRLLVFDFGLLFDLNFLIASVFPVAMLLLLIHPQSREYQRIWFR